MSRLALVAIGLVTCTLAACDKKKDGAGLPPASEWHAGSGGAVAGGGPAAVDPHAGMDVGGGAAAGGDPHAGMDMGGAAGGDPHAGMDMGGGAGGDPHAGMDMGGGGAQVPAKPVNPDRYLRGKVTISPKLKGQLTPGTALFLSVKRPDPKTGEAVGMPLVVERLELDPAGNPFDLSEANAMNGPGTVDLVGEVVITAHYDLDSNATSKQPGDVWGKVKVTVPAKDLDIVLDTVQP